MAMVRWVGLCGAVLVSLSCGSDGGSAGDGGQRDVPQVLSENTAEMCQDGQDNDADEFVDCADQDCWPFAGCETSRPDGWKPPGDADAAGASDGEAGASDGEAGADAPAPISCKVHCDCPQGMFCYYGTCLTDPKMPVYCCSDSDGDPKAGCPPGRWCFEPDGSKGTCAESTTHPCKDACDCGPSHCCKKAAGASTGHCVKDLADPWDPGGTVVGNLGTCERGEDATYCCSDPLCHAGKHAYKASSANFRCADRGADITSTVCGGRTCFATACNCDPGESCVDTTAVSPAMGKACGLLSGGACVSNAVAEAVYGFSPDQLLPCCTKGCLAGQPCEVGWRSDGEYAYVRVVGTCGGGCGNGSCDPGETAAGCPGDCGQSCGDGECFAGEVQSCAADCTAGRQCGETWTQQVICGDGICQGGQTCEWTEPESCRTCPQDCDACDWQIVHGQDGSLYLSPHLRGVWGSSSTDVFAVGRSGAIVHYDGKVWTAMFSGTVNDLRNIWGFSATNVFAVGGAGSSGELRHYDGVGWKTVNTGIASGIGDLWGTSSTDIFAVGGTANIMHYDGVTWAQISCGTSIRVSNLWGTSSTDVFAVGGDIGGPGYAAHYDGTSCTTMKANTNTPLADVWASSSTDAFAVGGQGLIQHYDGVKWSPMNSGSNDDLSAVWGSSATDVYAAGRKGPILHYDGIAWTSMTPQSSYTIRKIWGTSSTDIFAVGDDGLILHYDGTSWKSMTGEKKDWVWDVWGSSPTDVFAVGQHGLILHYDGVRWSPMVSNSTSYLTGVWGSSPTDVFVVGYPNSTILHFDGTAWSTISYAATSVSYRGIWGSASSDIYVVGDGILHYDGSSWTSTKTDVASSLAGVWGASSTEVFAVGWNGAIAHYDGASWSLMASGTTDSLRRVWGTSPTNVFAAVDPSYIVSRELLYLYMGWIMHYDGVSWAVIKTGAPQVLNDVYGSSPTNIFAVGNQATIVHYDGSAWSPARADFREPGAPTCRSFYGIGGAPPSAIFAVGQEGLIAQYCPAGSCPAASGPAPDSGVSPDGGVSPDAVVNPVCGNTTCELTESCDGQAGTTACPSDCPGLTTGPPKSQHCCVNGVCIGQGCPVAGCP